MKIQKLSIPSVVCPVCNKKFISTSSIAVISKDIITHAIRCGMIYLMDENQKLPEDKRERMTIWDTPTYFTAEYEGSNKAITEEQLKDYQTRFFRVNMLIDPIIIKRMIRDRIWNSVGRKYLAELQYIHLLKLIYERNKDKWHSGGFMTTFIPSVLTQFKAKGYTSKKQWALVEKLVNDLSTPEDRKYLFQALRKTDDMSTVELPDMLRFMQRKESFMEMYNEKHKIPEETD